MKSSQNLLPTLKAPYKCLLCHLSRAEAGVTHWRGTFVWGHRSEKHPVCGEPPIFPTCHQSSEFSCPLS